MLKLGRIDTIEYPSYYLKTVSKISFFTFYPIVITKMKAWIIYSPWRD